jgi:hypothetical protein
MTEVLLQGRIIAKTQTEKKQAVQGLALYKEAYDSAQKAIKDVFG